MAAVSETIVREYFELHGFLVRQPHKHIIQRRQDEEKEVDLLVVNPRPSLRSEPLPFLLETKHLPHVERAIVVVKGWHTETFSPAVLENSPEIFRFVSPGVLQQAIEDLGDKDPIHRILVIPALPQNQEARQESIEFLQAKGVNAVIPFRTVLSGLIDQVEVNRNYQKSDLLQIIRILKNYDLFREPQLELFTEPRRHG